MPLRGPPIVSSDDFMATLGPALTEHLTDLIHKKRLLVGGETLFRWVFSESDGIPGLIVDVFGDVIVCQIQSAPLEAFWPSVSECLKQAFLKATGQAIRTRVEKRSHSIRAKEGLPIIPNDQIIGAPLAPAEYSWNGLKWTLTPGMSQKTGAYLDQLTNHQTAVRWAKQLRLTEALDVCCFEGGFGLHLLKAGMKVAAVDVSEPALQALKQNAELNGMALDLLSIAQSDAFEFLKTFHKSGQRSEMIVLDPPPFAKSKEQADAGLRGFHDLNLRAVLALKPGGLLVSCSCSQAIGAQEMTQIFRKIAGSTGRSLKVLDRCGPSPDHMAPISFPEGHYLQAWFIQID